MQAALDDLKKAEKDGDPELLESTMTCITHRLVKKPNGDQDTEIIDLTSIVQEWSNVL